MRLRHSTPKRNLRSILRLGLLCSKSRGKLKAVWVHAKGKSTWATIHTVERHGGRVEEVVIVEVEVPRSWLRRHSRGLWACLEDVPPQRFKRLIGFGQLATSPVAEDWKPVVLAAG
jgi:hypothetical protein